jgi:SagB-type dehydrogenase family enzyme
MGHSGDYRSARSSNGTLSGSIVRPRNLCGDGKGFYQYIPGSHELERKSTEDLRRALYLASEQEAVLSGAVVFVIAVIYGRLAEKYGEERSVRYAHLEAGHAAQNLLLQAAALGLASVPVGAFQDEEVQRALSLPFEQTPVYLIPVGMAA